MTVRSVPGALGISHRRAAFMRLTTFIGGLALIVIALHFTGLAINVTDSMPVGLYHTVGVDRAPVKGDIVWLCATPAVAAVGRDRDYMVHGSCSHSTAPMLKIVAATAGDVVEVTPSAVLVDGHALPGSATQVRDTHGRPLDHVAPGSYRMRTGELWLWTPNPHSWDSRYYGPLPVANVSGYASLVLAFWDWPYARVR
ncbi:MAG: S26 family signal peptidase [Candidatus Eremiobacteraeota bacterium]|nr:S26 family signal peptidase [Candidatus Eremiobacteraeota bacterium]